MVCSFWQSGKCENDHCTLRHMELKVIAHWIHHRLDMFHWTYSKPLISKNSVITFFIRYRSNHLLPVYYLSYNIIYIYLCVLNFYVEKPESNTMLLGKTTNWMSQAILCVSTHQNPWSVSRRRYAKVTLNFGILFYMFVILFCCKLNL